MIPLLRVAYEASGQLARFLAAVMPASDGKLARTFRARRGVRRRYAAWGITGREPSRPLLWMHAPSVGESLQARPVLELLRGERPAIQLAYTYFSPSAARFAAGLDVDFRDVLPFDTAADTAVALEALRPTALVYSKLDVWPRLTREARARSVRLGLISATLAGSSSRRSAIALALLRDAYRLLDAVGAIDDDDAERLVELGVRREAITVTGDTRYDQVWQRAGEVDRGQPPISKLLDGRPTLVAGSTWPADEAVLLAAWAGVHRRFRDARLIIAPHEPTPDHLQPIEQWASGAHLRLARLDDPGAGTAEVVLVDRVGILGDLYAVAQMAFIGGGFHAAGLHSVLEPAAFGAPVLFGPRFQGSRDARRLIAAGGGASVTSAAQLTAAVEEWLSVPATRREAGELARAMVDGGRGAARRSFALVDRLMGT